MHVLNYITLDPTGSHSGSHPEVADGFEQNGHFLNSIMLDPIGSHSGSHPEIAESLKRNVHLLNCVAHWIPLDPILDPIRFEGSLKRNTNLEKPPLLLL